ncbi:serine/threonine-protein kinase HipA [Parabacteroides sp. PFB2-12]|uniref:type II toxin-antitoxin system HipA family toxin n=1 Tax=unclassified Parabacteroides TaxID=2649774 RepID=UPI002475CE93|nr:MULTISPECIES: type II toxin-antitoxin system HipA family toxin [unclassified Parabacteroides]MDH6343372.1 serine/threonine-protein kinase HipA [Parabacteroides sp. PM6-13]MDH6390388.1 serine/threonine-protein kinase HipA [Parabacteroides sp. PFB2-12]
MNTAIVKIWGKEVGAVAWDETTRLASFEYSPAFKKEGWELAPLKMPLTREQQVYSFPELRKERNSVYDTFKGLPGLLADMLPDRYGNDLINLWLAQQGRPENSMNPVEMLCFIGRRGMGALEFEPTIQKQHVNTFSVEVESLVEVAGKMLSKKEAFVTNLKSDEEKSVRDILKIGTSAGGARPKAVIAYNERTGEVRSGQTRAPEGFEHWLLKLDGVSDIQLGASLGYGRVEYAYYLMAIDCGLGMMPCRLLEENGRAHFMTRRFDREGPYIKHHTQTFCAMKHYDYNRITSYSYEQLFQTMRELKLSYAEAEQMFRRMVFNVIARNCDDHTKNFSFLLKQGGRWTLAPAYDICHAYRPGSEWVSQHALSINGKRSSITREDLLTIGHSIRNKKSKEIIDEINEKVQNWSYYASNAGVDNEKRLAIGKTLLVL